MAIINLTRLGVPTADYEAEKVALRLTRTLDRRQEYKTSSQCLWRAFQVLLAEGKIQPEQVAFQYEGEDLKHDRYGRIQLPPGYSDPTINLEARFKIAVNRTAITSLTDEQKTKLSELFRDWFKANMVEVFTKGTKFYLCTEHEDKSQISEAACKATPLLTVIPHPQPPEPEDESIDVAELVWATDQRNQPHLITDKGLIFWQDLQLAAFDLQGDRIIAKPYNQRRAFELAGADPTIFMEPSWYNRDTL